MSSGGSALRIVSLSLCWAVAVTAHSADYRTLDTQPAPELTAAQALETFRIAPGYRLELVAAEPLVEDPVAMDWDEAGAIYVAEMRGYMPDVYGTGQTDPVGAVIRLQDTDADGVIDERQVLLDGLVLPRAVRIVPQGLLIAEPPHLWLCPTDTGRSQDINCENKVDLGEYGNQPGSVEHAENGLLLGLDNWIYSAKSSRRLRLTANARGYIRGYIEEPTLFRGQWGIALDHEGRLFYNTNSNLLMVDLYDAQPAVEAGLARGPGLGVDISRDMELHSIRVNPGVNRAYVPGVLRDDGRLRRATSASGMTVYRDRWLGLGDGVHAFVAEPAANALVHLQITEDDGSLKASQQLYPDPEWGQREFLASTDERFRPVDVQLGPDGALYVLDMYRGIIQDHVFLSDELRAQILQRKLDKPLGLGRIWRVVPDDRQASSATDMSTFSSAQLVAELASVNGRRRDMAQARLLAISPDSATLAGLRNHLAGQREAAIHALWTLSGMAQLSRADVLTSLSAANESVRVTALDAGADQLQTGDILALAGKQMSRKERLAWLRAVRSHSHQDAVLAALVRVFQAHGEDVQIAFAVQTAVAGHELPFTAKLVSGGTDSAELLANLAHQSVGQTPTQGQRFLDFAFELGTSSQADAILAGLARLVQLPGFTRIELVEPHPVFDVAQQNWSRVAGARRAFTWPGDTLSAGAKPLSPEQQARMVLGEAYFNAQCAVCHGADGAGIGAAGPALVDSPRVRHAPELVARIVLHGLAGPLESNGRTWDSVMPGHAHLLDDETLSGLLTYLRRSWGHNDYAVFPDLVAQQRTVTADRQAPWTMAELADVPRNTYFRRYAGAYAGGLSFSYIDNSLHIASAIFNGPLQTRGEDQFLYEPRGLQLEFVGEPGKPVTGVMMQTETGQVLLPKETGQ